MATKRKRNGASVSSKKKSTSRKLPVEQETVLKRPCLEMENAAGFFLESRSALFPLSDIPRPRTPERKTCTLHVNNNQTAENLNRPPIKIVLKKSVDMTSYAPPSVSDKLTRFSDTVRHQESTGSPESSHSVAIEQIVEREQKVTQRLSDAGCPPMRRVVKEASFG